MSALHVLGALHQEGAMFPNLDAIDPERELYGDFDRQHGIDGCENAADGSGVFV